MTSLFEKRQFTSHSGILMEYKVECDALTNKSNEALAYMIQERFKFRHAIGIPSGGIIIADACNVYATNNENDPILIVDDVLSTGNSMEEQRKKTNENNVIGVVLFARDTSAVADWIYPLWSKWAK